MEFARALRIARARPEIWKFVQKKFVCPSCKKHKKPKSVHPAMLPKNFEPCRIVGIDVVFFPGLDVRKMRPILNMVDWVTGYQVLEPLDSMMSSHVWERFYGTWGRMFGIPEVIIVD